KVATATPPPPPPAAIRETPPPARQAERPTVTASAPAPRRAAEAAAAVSPKPLEDFLNQLLDAYFDYNNASLRTDAQTALSKDSEALTLLLREFPNTKFVVEGDCDERGSAEYNLALGERRAPTAQDCLTPVGGPAEQLAT